MLPKNIYSSNRYVAVTPEMIAKRCALSQWISHTRSCSAILSVSLSRSPFTVSRYSFSFASVNIPMVAIWLSSLTREERERFEALRRKFSEMQVNKVDKSLAVKYHLTVVLGGGSCAVYLGSSMTLLCTALKYSDSPIVEFHLAASSRQSGSTIMGNLGIPRAEAPYIAGE